MEGHAVKQALILAAALLLICSRAQAGDRQDCLDNFDKGVRSHVEVRPFGASTLDAVHVRLRHYPEVRSPGHHIRLGLVS